MDRERQKHGGGEREKETQTDRQAETQRNRDRKGRLTNLSARDAHGVIEECPDDSLIAGGRGQAAHVAEVSVSVLWHQVLQRHRLQGDA